MIKGIIFDLDGVLVSTDEQHYLAWQQLADQEGIYFDRTINYRLRGVSRMECLEIVLERATRAYTSAEKEILATQKNDWYRQSLAQLSAKQRLPGAYEMLVALRERGIKTAIGSSSRNTALILERTKLATLMDAVSDGNNIARSKPDPQVFEIAAQRLNLLPEECVVIEDAVAGVEAGKRAYMHVWGIGTPETLPGVKPLSIDLAHVPVEALITIDTYQ